MLFEDIDFNEGKNVRLIMLQLARDITIEEYTEKKIAVHTRWLSDSEKLWNNHRQILPYPVDPIYPNEEVIINKAKMLMNFIESE
jgi:hypothetical protein